MLFRQTIATARHGARMPSAVRVCRHSRASLSTLPGIETFVGDFSQPSIVPETANERVLELMASGRLFRYCSKNAEDSDASLAEKAVAEYIGQKYCIGVNSCSSAIYLALKCAGVGHGDEVITNGFTFTALPSTIVHLGATPILVEANPDFTMNLDDVILKAEQSTSKVILVSHFRGKQSNVDVIREICDERGLVMIEDCAHGMGITWNGQQAGNVGDIATYSVQSDKVVNAGEGGFLTTNNPEYIAKCIYWAGAYEKRYSYHLAAPTKDTKMMEECMTGMENCSMRMNNASGAMVCAQMEVLADRVENWNNNGAVLLDALSDVSDLLVVPPDLEPAVGCFDHCVFTLPSFDQEKRDLFVTLLAAHGVDVKPFGTDFNARFFKNWKFMGEIPDMPTTEAIVRHSFDMKCPYNFTPDDWVKIGGIISKVVRLVDQVDDIPEFYAADKRKQLH
jgi:dTDP-4-amino-4,6-dideoxygalactose transaminase